MIFHRMSSIFLYKKAEVFLLPFFFCPTAAGELFSAQASGGGKNMSGFLCGRLHFCTGDGARELRRRVRLTGESFVEPQQRNSPSADGGGRGTRRGGKKEGQPRFIRVAKSFSRAVRDYMSAFALRTPAFPLSLVWRRANVTASKRRTAEDFYFRVFLCQFRVRYGAPRSAHPTVTFMNIV